jgi:SpoVK/Ycf46/Vps4 family AAA+-type ATPase
VLDSSINISDIWSRVGALSKTNIGRKFFGIIAQPVFVKLQDLEYKKLAQEDDDIEPVDPPSGWNSFKDGFFNNFSWGDMFSTFGAVLLVAHNKLFKSSGEKSGFVENILKNFALITTFGGASSAMFGRMFDMHRKVALGDKYAEAKLSSAEKKGKKIFIEYSNEKISDLINESKKLDRILVYKEGLREMILERYEKEDIGGLFDGPPGTGKTEGVKCILGKWAKKNLAQGIQPVIAELNLAEFDDYLKETHQKTAELIEGAQAIAGFGTGQQASITHGDGLLILELLIKKIQKLINRVNRHNQTNSQKQKLAVFIDEFDKIFDPRSLKGCDKLRLKNLILQFNELFVKSNILLTSNTSLEKMISEIKAQLKSNDGDDAQEIWKPMYDRIASKNRSRIENPGARQQAEIVASRLIKNFMNNLDLASFGITQLPSDNFEQSRELLAKPLELVFNKLKINLNGRHLGYACDDLTSMLLGRARELKSQNAISDKDWEEMTTEEKISRTKAKIDLKLVALTLASKAFNDRSALIAQEDARHNKQEPADKDPNHRLISSILRTANDLVNKNHNVRPEEIISTLHKNYNQVSV